MVEVNCCNNPKVFELSNKKLCKEHFSEYFESKVFKTISQFNLIDKEENLGVALSGGKDSLTLLFILSKLAAKNPKIKLHAICIDEGIEGYRNKTIITAKEFCKKNDVPLDIYSYEKEFKMSLDKMLKTLDIKPCTMCGIFRRYLLNKKSKELNFTKLATGHNLDDEAQSIVMNQFKNNLMASARLGPISGIKKNRAFVPRIKPLYLCSEKEVATYAFINGILDDFTECPNVVKSYRAQVRDMLNNFENNNLGTKNAIVNSFLEILPELKEKYKFGEAGMCKECGEVASKDKCNACKLLDRLEKAKTNS